jgi:drug/metabolite transporter (DMT)-like permease
LALPARPQATLLLAVSTTVLLWASAFVAIRAATRWFGPAELALLRFAIASLVFAIWAMLARPSLPGRRDLLLLLVAGGLGIAAYNVLLNAGERRLDAGTAAMLVNTGPLWVALLAGLLLRETVGRRLVLGMVVSFAGVSLIGGSGGGLGLASSAVLVLLAALAQAAQFVLQRPVLARLHPAAVTAFAIWAGTLFLLPATASLGAQLADAPIRAVGIVLYLAVLPGALAYFAWAYALVRVEAARLARTLYLVPAITILLSWALLGEGPGASALAGGALAIAGVVIGREASPRSD